MKSAYALFAFIGIMIMAGFSFANGMYVNIVHPVNITVNASAANTVYLGQDGPGQTFSISINAQTQSPNGTVYDLGWNEFNAYNMPENWTVENSSQNNKVLTIEIKPSPLAKQGLYKMHFEAVNIGNYSKLGTLKFNATIYITPKVYNISIENTSINAGLGQPAAFTVLVKNLGVSDTPFIISSKGLPGFSNNITVISPHNSVQEFKYYVFANEPGVYNINISVNALSSPLIFKNTNATLTIRPTIVNDYKSIGNGALIFPVVYQPAYSVMYLIYALGHYLHNAIK